MKVGDLVAVFWHDSHAHVSDAWVRSSELDNKLPVLCTLGVVVKRDKKAVTLAASFAVDVDDEDDEQLGGVMVIPRRTIVEVKDLEWKRRRG